MSASQHRRFSVVLAMTRELHNAGLEAWRDGYRMWKQAPDPRRAKMRFSFFDNCKTLTEMRAEDPQWAALAVSVGRGALQRLDRSIRRFYDGKAGYPRFKSARRWRSVCVPDARWGMVVPPRGGGKWWRLRVKGLPGVRFADERLAGIRDNAELLEIRLVRTALRTEVQFAVREEVPEPITEPLRPVGLDAGITHRFALSDGATVPQRTHERLQIKRRQRAVSRSVKGSHSRRKKARLLAKEHARRAEARRDEDFRVIAGLAERFDGFAVEDLRIANMIRNRRLADRIAQQGWAAFTQRLQHKAERAGLRFAKAPSAFTSQECSACGHRLEDRLTLRDRAFVCPECGLTADRDTNAAVNICVAAYGHCPHTASRAGKHRTHAAPGARRSSPHSGLGQLPGNRPESATADKTGTAKAAPARRPRRTAHTAKPSA